MTQEIVEVPDFKFGIYYPEILEALLEFKRANVPELSDESEFEPSIQLLRAFAIATHEHNVLLDVVAQESVLSTARLVESVRALLKSQGYQLRSAQPAKASLVLELSGPINTPRVIAPAGAQFSTERDSVTGSTSYFQADDTVSSSETELFSSVFSTEDDIWTNRTASCNTPTTPTTDWTPWGTPTTGDSLYFCHDSVMWDRLDMFVSNETVPDSGFGVWEYYNGDTVRARPDTAVHIGSRIRFVVNSYLGEENRNGTIIRVRLNSTLDYEDGTVFWDGLQNVVEVGLIGQAFPSQVASDYTVGSEWEPLSGLVTSSGVGDLYVGVDDELSWTLPQSSSQNWVKTELQGVEGYWMRFRWIEAPSSGPTMRYIRMVEGKQYIKCSVTQGREFVDSPLGSSDGTSNQTFSGSKSNFIDDGNDELLVDGVVWERVSDFLSSSPTDQHYVVELTGEDASGLVLFGNGTTGAVPNFGVSNLVWTYRYGASEDGNVGPSSIVKDLSSLVYVNRTWNPRQAIGWSAQEGGTEQSLQRAKQLAARMNQTKGVAVSADDLPPLTVRYQDSEGSSPFARAFAIEEAYGPKTIGLVVMPSGGSVATQNELDDLATFFNGDKTVSPAIKARLVSNHRVVAINFEPRSIDIDAIVYAKNVTRQEVENNLRTIFQPDAKDSSGNWIWEFADLISVSRIDHEIHKISANIKTVTINSPTQDLKLDGRELPVIGTLNITVIDPSKG